MTEARDGARAGGACLAAALWVAVLPITAWACLMAHVTLVSGNYALTQPQAFALALLALVLVRALWRHVPRAARVVLALHVPVNLWTIFAAGHWMWSAWL